MKRKHSKAIFDKRSFITKVRRVMKESVGNLPDGYTRTVTLPRVNTRVNQSGLSLAKPGRAMASTTWNMANQGSAWQLLQIII